MIQLSRNCLVGMRSHSDAICRQNDIISQPDGGARKHSSLYGNSPRYLEFSRCIRMFRSITATSQIHEEIRFEWSTITKCTGKIPANRAKGMAYGAFIYEVWHYSTNTGNVCCFYSEFDGKSTQTCAKLWAWSIYKHVKRGGKKIRRMAMWIHTL